MIFLNVQKFQESVGAGLCVQSSGNGDMAAFSNGFNFFQKLFGGNVADRKVADTNVASNLISAEMFLVCLQPLQ